MLNLIVAVDENYGIGKDNDILYHFPSDLKRFKEVTSNTIIVMGRKTFESLPKKLPNRIHVVLSSKDKVEGADYTVSNINSVIALSEHYDVWVIGGSSVYKELLPYVHCIELTQIKGQKENDTHVKFLESELKNFRIVKGKRIKDIDTKTNQQHDVAFTTLVRKI